MRPRNDFFMRLRPGRRGLLTILTCATVFLPAPAIATHITRAASAGSYQLPRHDPGYLEYKVNPAAGRFGEEWTGWIDVRHPAMDGTEQTFDPFDRSNRFVNVHNKIVTDGSTPRQTATPDLIRDYDFGNKIYAQAGISVVSTGNQAVTQGDVTFPLDFDERTKVLSNNRVGGKTVNDYYIAGFSDITANALTRQPATSPTTHGTLISTAVSSTFAHELGHMLLNGNALHDECAAPPADAGPSESCDTRNWMFKSGSTFTFAEVTKTKGRIEDVQIDRLFANGGANNPGFVQGIAENALFHRYGNAVDWDFVTDHTNLEDRANGADSHVGTDSLYWEIGNPVPPANHDGHKHTGLGEFDPLGAFTGRSFRLADVFSLSARYSDYDEGPSPRETSLDYRLFFRAANGDFDIGVPERIFSFGWTPNTNADNFLTRWRSPFDAVGVFIFAESGFGHDGITQIDAVIAARVFEPSTLLLLGAGLAGLSGVGRRWRRPG